MKKRKLLIISSIIILVPLTLLLLNLSTNKKDFKTYFTLIPNIGVIETISEDGISYFLDSPISKSQDNYTLTVKEAFFDEKAENLLLRMEYSIVTSDKKDFQYIFGSRENENNRPQPSVCIGKNKLQPARKAVGGLSGNEMSYEFSGLYKVKKQKLSEEIVLTFEGITLNFTLKSKKGKTDIKELGENIDIGNGLSLIFEKGQYNTQNGVFFYLHSDNSIYSNEHLLWLFTQDQSSKLTITEKDSHKIVSNDVDVINSTVLFVHLNDNEIDLKNYDVSLHSTIGTAYCGKNNTLSLDLSKNNSGKIHELTGEHSIKLENVYIKNKELFIEIEDKAEIPYLSGKIKLYMQNNNQESSFISVYKDKSDVKVFSHPIDNSADNVVIKAEVLMYIEIDI